MPCDTLLHQLTRGKVSMWDWLQLSSLLFTRRNCLAHPLLVHETLPLDALL